MIAAPVRLAAGYFIYFAAVGVFTPFWSPYLAWRGFSAIEISWLLAASAAVRAVGPLLIGWLADLNHPTQVMRLAALLALASFMVLPTSASLPGFLAFSVLFSLTWNAVVPLVDVHTLTHPDAGAAGYGRIRLWGSIGFIVAAWLAGTAFQRVAYGILPGILVTLVALTLLVTLLIRPLAPPVVTAVGPGFVALLRTRAAAVSLLIAALMAISFGAYYTFFSLYLERYGYSRQMIGLLWALGVVAEIVVFAAGQPLLRRFSIRSLFLLAAGGTGVRWLLVALLVQQPLVLALSQLLHCLGFAVLHYAIVLTAQRLFAPGMESRGQTLFSSVGYGLGGTLGTLLAGMMWTVFSPRASYVSAAFIVVLAAVLAAVGLRGTALDKAPVVRDTEKSRT